MLLPTFRSLLAKSYAEGFIILPGIDAAERSEATPVKETLTACW